MFHLRLSVTLTNTLETSSAPSARSEQHHTQPRAAGAECVRVRTCAIIKPDAYAHLGKILDAAHSVGLVVRVEKGCLVVRAVCGRWGT